MSNLYEINDKLYYLIESGFDSETGEVLNQEDLNKAINETTMELDKKIDNIAKFIKNLDSDIEALKKEKQNLQQRIKVKENKLNSLKQYLDGYFKYSQPEYFDDVSGSVKFKKFETPSCVISYRKSDSVKIVDVNKIPKQYIKQRILSEDDVNKTEIKNYLKLHDNEEVEGAILLHNKTINIK